MKVCYFTADFSGAGCYRCLFPGQELIRQFGHECFIPEPKELRPGYFMFDLKSFPTADLYVLQQRPEKEWLKIIPFLKDRGKRVVCETDDYYLGVPTWHPAYKATRPLVKDLHTIYGMADAMTVSTPFLQEVYSEYNDNVYLLPNYWDQEMWQHLPKKNWDRVRIGWMGVSDMRPSDLEVLKRFMHGFMHRHPEVDFVAAGDHKVHDILNIPQKQRVYLENLDFPVEGEPGRVHFPGTPSLMQFDIGLVPLSDHDFNHAKSYLKGMEYNIASIPYVASPTRPYREYTDEGSNGFLAKTPGDWTRALEILVGDGALRRRMAEAARQKALGFTIQRHAYRWEEVYSRLIGDGYDQIARDSVDRSAIQKPEELADFLRYAASRKKPEVVVEIGTAQGGMLYALAQAAADDALIVSIDLPGGDQDETSEDDKYGQRDVPKMASYGKKNQTLEFLQMDSQDKATRATLERILGGRRIDLLFIDGDHSYDGVRKDFELYRSLVTPGGVIGFHDIIKHAPNRGSEVDKFWHEIKGDYTYKEFTHGADWGWGPWGVSAYSRCNRRRY